MPVCSWPTTREVSPLFVATRTKFVSPAKESYSSFPSYSRGMNHGTGQGSALLEQSGYFYRLGSPICGALAVQAAEDPLVVGLLEDWTRNDVKLLFASLHYLKLTGSSPDVFSGNYQDFRDVVVAERDFLLSFMAEQNVQTHEVQRCFSLLPIFLEVSRLLGEEMDLIELGPSGGLNLLWSDYSYRYQEGSWGPRDSPLLIAGEERRPVPASLLEARVKVGRRQGIDLEPVDITTSHGLNLLRSFIRFGDNERDQRLCQAAQLIQQTSNPPSLVKGDYLDKLPELLEARATDKPTVIFQTASTVYLTTDELSRLQDMIREAGQKGSPLAWVSTLRWDEEEISEDPAEGEGWNIALEVWPLAERRVVARSAFFGEWLEWRGW